MAKYIVTFPIVINDNLRTTNTTTLKTVTVYSEELANKIVDEILLHRSTGEKSAYMLYLEQELCGEFKQTSRSVLYIDRVEEKRLRAEGGAYDMLREVRKESHEPA